MWRHFNQNIIFDETSFFLTLEGRLSLLVISDKIDRVLLTAAQIYQIQSICFVNNKSVSTTAQFVYYRQIHNAIQRLYFSNFLSITTFLITHFPTMIRSKIYNDLVFCCLAYSEYSRYNNKISFDCNWLTPDNSHTLRAFWYKRKFWEAKLYRQSFQATSVFFYLLLLEPWYADKNYANPKEFWYNFNGFECTPTYCDEELYIEEI